MEVIGIESNSSVPDFRQGNLFQNGLHDADTFERGLFQTNSHQSGLGHFVLDLTSYQ